MSDIRAIDVCRELADGRANIAAYYCQARIQGVGAIGWAVGTYPWDGISPFKIHYSIAFKHQFVTWRPALEEILYPPLTVVLDWCPVIDPELCLVPINTSNTLFIAGKVMDDEY